MATSRLQRLLFGLNFVLFASFFYVKSSNRTTTDIADVDVSKPDVSSQLNLIIYSWKEHELWLMRELVGVIHVLI